MQVVVVIFKENQIEERLSKDIQIYKLEAVSSRYNPLLYLELRNIIKQINPKKSFHEEYLLLICGSLYGRIKIE